MNAGLTARTGSSSLVLLVMLLEAGCARTAIPSTSPDVIATIVAATQRAAPTLTLTPLLPSSPTARPTATPQPTPILGTPAAPTRLTLLNGAASAIVNGTIGPRESQSFVVRGVQGEPMLVQLDSSSGEAAMSMMSHGGTFFVRPGTSDFWRGTLPEAGDYYLGVYGGTTSTDYQLSVTLVSRVRFKEGENKATVVGRAPDGTEAALSVFAIKGQKLILTLSGVGSRAAMGVEGFVDRKSYLGASDSQTSFQLVAPVTQDYIILIVPNAGQSVGFVFDVSIE